MAGDGYRGKDTRLHTYMATLLCAPLHVTKICNSVGESKSLVLKVKKLLNCNEYIIEVWCVRHMNIYTIYSASLVLVALHY